MRLKILFVCGMAVAGVGSAVGGFPPPTPSPTHHVKPISQGAGAAKLVRAAVVAKPKTLKLSWDQKSNVTFNVHYLRTNTFVKPSITWPIYTNTPNNSVVIAVDPTAQVVWFTVSAVNSNGESGPATKMKLEQ